MTKVIANSHNIRQGHISHYIFRTDNLNQNNQVVKHSTYFDSKFSLHLCYRESRFLRKLPWNKLFLHLLEER
jgi:hypothetical protein